MVFKKQLMLERVKKEGLMHLIGSREMAIMNNLDGQEVTVASWNRTVYDAPVYSCKGRDGKYYDVNEADCE